MNKLTKTRFSAVLLISDVFALFCLMGNISVMTVWGFIGGTALQMILAFPLAFSVRKGKSIEKCGKPVQIFFIIYLILWGGMIFSMLWNTSEVIYIPYENSGTWGKFTVSAALGIVCLYMTAAGMKTLLRSSLIAAAAGGVCIVIVAVSALTDSNFGNLKLSHSENFLNEFSKGIALSGSLGSFVLLLGNTEGDAVINSMIYFCAKALITAVILITSILLTGGIMEITDFPAVMSAHLSQPFPSQRIDSLFLIIFSVFGAFSAALQLALAVYLVKTISDAEKYISMIILSLSIASAFIFQGNSFQGIIPAICILSALVIPLFSLRRKT